MDVIFVRHKLSSTDEILEELWEQRLIAIHYQDLESVDPNDYEGPGKNALNRLWDYCDEGMIACATYRRIRPSKILLGKIKKGSKVKWRRYEQFVYKIVQLVEAVEISYQDYPLLSAIQPYGGTISRWPSAKKHIEAIYHGEPLEWDVYSLHPSQVEVLCYEYLRSLDIIKSLLMPLGRSMLDIDIYGLTKGNGIILAQVTMSDNQDENTEKISVLTSYKANKARLIYFGRRKFNTNRTGIEYISIEDVFDYFDHASRESPENCLLKIMLNAG